ncbi:ImmA/IrrE family metallo-endopeptidase [Leucobacter sp. CSA1]|uniref:ImmA/IrrE family metallo-endopeptidase n=1 Tax=Leucobacter chromiisoli TaxID=2796471 RepID=A0A934UVB2_9MICO|nr:ImmA/IrrE family metallo-endopeptidase [Leucobacter chromiisoli]MBK0420394.1 ImmA/IrrE family metallo-endopeptidase [Leucobacter chromiisoli]
MQALYDYAASRGVRIEYCDLRHLNRAGDCHPTTKTIRIQRGLLYRKERSVLAHELAHEYYGDEPDMFGKLSNRAEDRANEWAAHFLINPDEYRVAEEKYGTNTQWIAQELCVLQKLVVAYERTLCRIGDHVYINPRHGIGQWDARIKVVA